MAPSVTLTETNANYPLTTYPLGFEIKPVSETSAPSVRVKRQIEEEGGKTSAKVFP